MQQPTSTPADVPDDTSDSTTPKPVPTKRQTAFSHVFLVYQQFASVVLYIMISQIMQDGLQYNAYLFMRLAIAIPFLQIAMYVATKKLLPERRHILWLVLGGILSTVCIQLVITYGLTLTTPANASIITAPCIPLFTSALSIMRGTDKISWMKGVGFIFALGGALILLEIENFTFEGKTIGNLLIIASAVGSACNVLLQRKLLDDGVHPVSLIAHTTTYGWLIYVAIFSHIGLFHAENWHFTTANTLKLCFVSIFVTVIPWVGVSYALKSTSPMTVSIYVVSQPPIAAMIGLFMGEKYTWHQGVGSVLVLAGLFTVNAEKRATRILTNIQNKILRKTPSHKHFQLLQNTEEGDEEAGTKLTEISEVKSKLIVLADGASTYEEEYTEDNSPLKRTTA